MDAIWQYLMVVLSAVIVVGGGIYWLATPSQERRGNASDLNVTASDNNRLAGAVPGSAKKKNIDIYG